MGQSRPRLSSILSLVKGTVLAQLVFVFATPVLTRIYTVEELGVFALFTAMVLILCRFAGLRYELAIPLPALDETAIHLVLLTFLLSLAMLIIAGSAYTIAVYYLDFISDIHVLQEYLLVLGASVVLFVLNESLVFWFIRKKDFSTIARARVTNAIALAILQLFGYFISGKILILITAYPLALAISCVFLLGRVDRRIFAYRTHTGRLLKALIVRYRKFPMFTSWSTGLYELSQAFPLFFLASFFGNLEAGYFFLARRIGLIPTSIVGRAITQVNHADMAEQKNMVDLGEILVRQIQGLQWVSIVPAVLLAFYAPDICERILGAEWREAGRYLQVLAPYVVVRLVFSPMAAINYVAEWQKLALWFEILSTTLSSLALLWFAINGTAYQAVAAYFYTLGIASLLYGVYLMQRIEAPIWKLLRPGVLQLAALGLLYITGKFVMS
ncbi:MAG: lipopolysaccharide biosynthesis protein [Granulosicoccus sp.]